MKLWLISQTQNDDYDTYDAAVVTAESEEEAAKIIPGGGLCKWNDEGKMANAYGSPYLYGSWAHDLSEVKVEYLGEAVDSVATIVLASFNAG